MRTHQLVVRPAPLWPVSDRGRPHHRAASHAHDTISTPSTLTTAHARPCCSLVFRLVPPPQSLRSSGHNGTAPRGTPHTRERSLLLANLCVDTLSAGTQSDANSWHSCSSITRPRTQCSTTRPRPTRSSTTPSARTRQRSGASSQAMPPCRCARTIAARTIVIVASRHLIAQKRRSVQPKGLVI